MEKRKGGNKVDISKFQRGGGGTFWHKKKGR